MNLLLDNLFTIGQLASLAGLFWGAWLVVRENLIDSVCPARKTGGQVVSLASCLLHPVRRTARA